MVTELARHGDQAVVVQCDLKSVRRAALAKELGPKKIRVNSITICRTMEIARRAALEENATNSQKIIPQVTGIINIGNV